MKSLQENTNGSASRMAAGAASSAAAALALSESIASRTRA